MVKLCLESLIIFIMADCFSINTPLACFRPTDTTLAPVSLFVHLKYGEKEGSEPSQVLTTADDLSTPIDPATYLGGGTVTAGACDLPKPTTVIKDLCELLADGSTVNFCRVITTNYDAIGTPLPPVPTDYEADLVTEYTVVDEANVAGRPEKCLPLVNTGLQTDWSLFV